MIKVIKLLIALALLINLSTSLSCFENPQCEGICYSICTRNFEESFKIFSGCFLENNEFIQLNESSF
jgi:hypothetical protein